MRRASGRTAVALTGTLILIGACFTQQDDREAGSDESHPQVGNQVRGPNILIILTDDQPAQGTMMMMPRTRRLFRRSGTFFSEAFATTPQCCPSRATIFSGRYAHNHGVRINLESKRLDQASTLQKYLQDNGYRNALFGKFLNNWPVTEVPQYFDEWLVPESHSGYNRARWNVNGDVRDIRMYATMVVQRAALKFLEKAESDDTQPWFMFLSTRAPHAPYQPEREHRQTDVPAWEPSPAVLEKDLRDKPSFIPEWIDRELFSMSRVRALRRDQLRTLLSVDNLVGSVFRSLDELDEDGRTLAIFMSDNGYLWGDHGLAGPGYGKRTPYENSIRIPLFLRWPGHVRGGHVDRRLVANVDVVPTVLDAAGLLPGGAMPLDGRSLLGGDVRGHLLFEHWPDTRSTIPRWNAVRTAEYTYAEYYGGDGETVYREFYDLASDPDQLTNLLGDRTSRNDPEPGLIARLSKQIADDRDCEGAACP